MYCCLLHRHQKPCGVCTDAAWALQMRYPVLQPTLQGASCFRVVSDLHSHKNPPGMWWQVPSLVADAVCTKLLCVTAPCCRHLLFLEIWTKSYSWLLAIQLLASSQVAMSAASILCGKHKWVAGVGHCLASVSQVVVK